MNLSARRESLMSTIFVYEVSKTASSQSSTSQIDILQAATHHSIFTCEP